MTQHTRTQISHVRREQMWHEQYRKMGYEDCACQCLAPLATQDGPTCGCGSLAIGVSSISSCFASRSLQKYISGPSNNEWTVVPCGRYGNIKTVFLLFILRYFVIVELSRWIRRLLMFLEPADAEEERVRSYPIFLTSNVVALAMDAVSFRLKRI